MTSEHTLVIEARETAGFFSNFNCVVDHLHHSLGRYGCRSVRVDWRPATDQAGRFAYGTEADGNLWDHFFEPLDFPNASPHEVRTNEFADGRMTGRSAYAMYKLDRGWRDRYHRVYTRFIRIHPRIVDRVERIVSEQMNGRFSVGVHFRHPVHDYEEPRPSPGVFKHALWARRLPPQGDHGRVVLATDVEDCVDYFRDVFGSRLVVQAGVERASLTGDREVMDGPAHPRVGLGEQVLVDAMLLSRCQVLIHGTSNIATASGYMNPALRMLYCEPPFIGICASLAMRLQSLVPPALHGRVRSVAYEAQERIVERAWLEAQRARALTAWRSR